MRDFVSLKAASVSLSGIRRFFDTAARMKDVISLGIGKSDFMKTPETIRAGTDSLSWDETHPTSNSATIEFRRALSGYVLHVIAGC